MITARFCSLLILSATLALAQSAKDTRAPKDMPTADELKNPPKSWIDKDTGHRIVRLTDEPGSASFYFNVNAYTPDGSEMVYTTPEGINVLDLKTYKTRSVVKGKVTTIVVGRKTPSVFYIQHEDSLLYATNVDTGVTRKLGKVPEHGAIQTVNADETLASGTYDEVAPATANSQAGTAQLHALEQAANKGQMMEMRLAERRPVVIFTMNLTDGTVKPLLHSTDWIGHMLFSPADPSLLMYCHEGPWQKVARIWTIRTDGSHNELMHKRTMFMEIAGHEFWGYQGDTVYYDLQTPKGEDFWLATLNLNTQKREWFHMNRDEWSIHFNVSKDRTMYTGDGGDPGQVARATNGEWIYLFRPKTTKQVDGHQRSIPHSSRQNIGL